ncbi:hypothetical protein GCM10020229_15630 [Kitasatospora albolonga]
MDTVCDRLLPQLPEVVAALDPAPGGAALDAPEYAAAVIERHAPSPRQPSHRPDRQDPRAAYPVSRVPRAPRIRERRIP